MSPHIRNDMEFIKSCFRSGIRLAYAGAWILLASVIFLILHPEGWIKVEVGIICSILSIATICISEFFIYEKEA